MQISKLIQEIVEIKFFPENEEAQSFHNVRKSVSSITSYPNPPSQFTFNKSESKAESTAMTNNTQDILERFRLRKQLSQKQLFSLDKFTDLVDSLHVKSDEILEYFFLYIKYILDHTRQRFFDKLRFYERLNVQTNEK